MSRVRHSLAYIQYLYDSGEDRTKLENLVRAFRGIQALPPDDHNSFFYLAGLHGLPYRGPGETDPKWWGGYCWHGSVLFPTWHRIYVLKLEDALRSIPGCQDVTLPFWDQLANLDAPGQPLIPSVLTSPTFELDGRTDNPLYSYTLQKELVQIVEGTNHRYSKHKGYNTVRYPLSGLVGTEEDREETEIHNSRFQDQAENVTILNKNVTEWLLGTVKIPDDPEHTRQPDTFSVRARLVRCLLAPNYTVFSNTASQNQWIKDAGHDPSTSHYVVSLESPHNAIHLAVGGFYQAGVYNAAPIRGANGDMGDNETAGFDPIFYFHHCFIDYTFMIWQRIWDRTKRGCLDIIQGYPGTILEQGQPPNFPTGTHVDMSTPLLPFTKADSSYFTSDDATDIAELGYSYGVGSLDPIAPRDFQLGRTGKTVYESLLHNIPDPTIIEGQNPKAPNPFAVMKHVRNISRNHYESSFVVRLYAHTYDGQEVEVGREPVLSRWNAKGCANCQNHEDVDLYVPIPPTTLRLLEGPQKVPVKWSVKVQTRDGQLQEFPPVLTGPQRGGHPEAPRGTPIVEDL
ncbi:hypothetical protein D9613_002272 [Agrocybe pediades]|uniref:tyrosinase n=1 Tax=Agrocybe pediades TaxID=84607 RepID=A0A8H4R646_9AGAR|nr:hypothetical protein D9613_002272 [Agrocybe pediades]